jgi:hypothetical protein
MTMPLRKCRKDQSDHSEHDKDLNARQRYKQLEWSPKFVHFTQNRVSNSGGNLAFLSGPKVKPAISLPKDLASIMLVNGVQDA